MPDVKLEVQAGFQERVHKCKADIAIIGGAMGSGKSFSLILEVMKYVNDPHYRCGIFRKNRATILCPGGLWEELLGVAAQCYLPVKTNRHELKVTFPSGAVVQFGHANHPNFKAHLKGTQYTCVFIDEGDEFEEDVFKFLLARLRSKSQVKPYLRLTTNPTNCWIKGMIKPYLDDDDYPIGKECEKTKYLYYINNKPILKDTKQAFVDECGLPEEDMQYIRTFAFIPGRVDENKKLLRVNPEYVANLKSLAEHERDRYLYGWWGELPRDGLFQITDFHLYSVMPSETDRCIITVDTAMKTGKENDYTVACCWALKGKDIYLIDMLRGKWKYAAMKERMKTFIESNHFIDTFYSEDIHTGSVLMDDMRSEFRNIRFRPVPREYNLISKRVQPASKARRAQNAFDHMDKMNVYLPLEADKMRRVFLKEVCAFSLDMSHKHDDICDCFFDAVSIFGRQHKTNLTEWKEQKRNLSQKIEQIGSMSGISG